MKVAVIKTNGYIDGRIIRTLENNRIKGDLIDKITRQTITTYDAIVFSYKSTIPNIVKLLEKLALEKKVLVVYVNNTLSIGQFYNLLNDEFFTIVEEHHLDFELPSRLHNCIKYIKKIQLLNQQYDVIKDELELMKLTNKAKLTLMKKGLSEAESHRFIQSKAMELRVGKKKLVNLIIQNKIDI